MQDQEDRFVADDDLAELPLYKFLIKTVRSWDVAEWLRAGLLLGFFFAAGGIFFLSVAIAQQFLGHEDAARIPFLWTKVFVSIFAGLLGIIGIVSLMVLRLQRYGGAFFEKRESSMGRQFLKVAVVAALIVGAWIALGEARVVP